MAQSDATAIEPLVALLRDAALALEDASPAARARARLAIPADALRAFQSFAAAAGHDANAHAAADAEPVLRDGIAGLPPEVFQTIISFVGFRALFNCAVTCRAFRDAHATLPQLLLQGLALDYYPLLQTVAPSAPIAAQPPRDLVRAFRCAHQQDLDYLNDWPPQPQSTLAEYRLMLSLTHNGGELHAGTGVLDADGDNTGRYIFSVPGGAVTDRSQLNDVRAKVMASRQVGNRLHFALLYEGEVMTDNYDDDDRPVIEFDWLPIARDPRNKALAWKMHYSSAFEYADPELRIIWNVDWTGETDLSEETEVDVRFVFYDSQNGEDFPRDMSLADTCMCIESFVAWSD